MTKAAKVHQTRIIEITYPSNAGYDYFTKSAKYQTAGVKEYWIVNPMNQSVLIYHFTDNILPISYTFKDKIKVNIYDVLVIDFNELNIG